MRFFSSIGSASRAILGAGTALTILIAAGPAARAERFIPIGARQRALGGAGVAVTEDATAIYWNPANLSFLPLNRPPYAVEKRPEREEPAHEKVVPEGKTGTAEPEGLGEDEGAGEKEKGEGKGNEQGKEQGKGGKGQGKEQGKGQGEGGKAREGRDGKGGEEFPPEAPADRWSGYDECQVELVANAELKLTGDIVGRLDRLDRLIADSDIQGAADRASQTPPAITQQDFRNLIRFYEEVDNLDQGGDGIAELAGGLFTRYRGFGIAAYSNTYIGLRPTVNLGSNAGFSDTAGVDAVTNQVDPGHAPPTTAAGINFSNQLQAAPFNLSANSANSIARLAEESGVDLTAPDLRAALGIAAQQSGAGGGTDIRHNRSGVSVSTLSTQELALGLGIDVVPDVIGVGVAPKLMYGVTARDEILVVDTLLDNQKFNDITKYFIDRTERTVQFGVDAGVTVQPTSWLRVAAVGRNLNNPRFAFKDGGTFELKRQFRGGIAIRPVPAFMLTVDADLVPNHSEALPGFRSRVIGGGFEINPDWEFAGIAIRGGCYGDLEDPRHETRPIFTAGIGVKVGIMTVDLAGAVSTKRETFRDKEIPSDIGLAAQFGFGW